MNFVNLLIVWVLMMAAKIKQVKIFACRSAWQLESAVNSFIAALPADSGATVSCSVAPWSDDGVGGVEFVGFEYYLA